MVKSPKWQDKHMLLLNEPIQPPPSSLWWLFCVSLCEVPCKRHGIGVCYGRSSWWFFISVAFKRFKSKFQFSKSYWENRFVQQTAYIMQEPSLLCLWVGCASSQGSMKQPSPINKPAFNANSHLGQNVRSGGRERWLIPQNLILMDAWKISSICLSKFYRPLDFQLEPGSLLSLMSSSYFRYKSAPFSNGC